MQLRMFTCTPEQAPLPSGAPINEPTEDPPKARDPFVSLIHENRTRDDRQAEAVPALDPFDLLRLDPLLTDVTMDATGIMTEPAWSAIFATQNLLDQLGLGIADQQEAYEQRLYDVLWRAKLELDLLGHPQPRVPFYYQTERTNLHLALILRDECQPPAAVIGLAEDF